MFSIAAREHRVDIAESLIRRGANLENGTDWSGNTPVVAAVVSRDIDIIRLMLRNGADVNGQVYHKSALRPAIQSHSAELVELLIQEGGADVNQSEGEALYRAALFGDIAIVDMLLRNGAHISPTTPMRSRALEGAAFNSRDEVFDLLVQRGANVNHTNELGIGGLCRAALDGRCDVIRMYLRNGADIDIIDTRRETSLTRAVTRGHVAVVDLLIGRGINIEASNSRGQTALDVARRHLDKHRDDDRYIAIVALIEAALAEKHNAGSTSMEAAIYSTTPRPSSMIGMDQSRCLETGTSGLGGANILNGYWRGISVSDFECWIDSEVVDINEFRIGKRTLVANAVGEHRLDLIEVLARRGANLDFSGGVEGYTPLMMAVSRGDDDTVRLLLQRGADVNRYLVLDPSYRCTALGLAVITNRRELVDLLVHTSGADVTLAERAFAAAAKGGNFDMVEILLRDIPHLNPAENNFGATCLSAVALSGFTANRKEELFVYLIKRGANINQTLNCGNVGLAVAALKGRLDIVELYLRNGADTDIIDKSGETVLIRAAKNGLVAVVEFLIQNGIDVEVSNNRGQTPLEVARLYLSCHRNDQRYIAIVRLIEEALAEKSHPHVLK